MRTNLSKLALMASFVLAMSFNSAYAQGVYFDIGLGYGSATTKLDGHDVSDGTPSDINEIGVDFGLKVGYGPFPAPVPVYVVGVLGGIGHRFYKDSDYVQFNSYLFGPGVIVYPVDILQLGFAIGTSWVANQTSDPIKMYDSDGGHAWELSAAVDLGGESHACLLGIKYFSATNTLKTSKVEQESSAVSIFVKYAFRTK